MTQLLFLDLVEGTSWEDVCAMTGMGFGVVFVVLILLVIVLWAFGFCANMLNKPKKSAAPVAQPVVAAQPVASASDKDKAAVAMALYLYFKDVHDEETGILTIQHNSRSAWHHELNKHLNQD